MSRFRSCMLVRGAAEDTREQARALVAALSAERVLWVSDEPADAAFPTAVSPAAVKRRLGRSFDAVVLDLHPGIDADVLGQCHGFIWGGGALVLRMPDVGVACAPAASPLAVYPFEDRDVGTRFWQRFERVLARSAAIAPASPLRPLDVVVGGTEDQARVAEQLGDIFASDAPGLVALTADRGRGKSSALGLAIARVLQRRACNVVVTAPTEGAAAEVLRFAATAERATACVRFASPYELLQEPLNELLNGEGAPDVLVVDEAAQLPVPLLESLTRRFPRTHIAFATTTRGYEGTGRGFVLRFLEWARRGPRPLTELSLQEPIRWDAGDPLERLIFDALALDASPAPSTSFSLKSAAERVEHVVIDRDGLSRDEALLHDLFGLLVHAHYRTTPSDLHRALDAPNLSLHALRLEGRVVAASLLAREGGLPPDVCEELLQGKRRMRGHALAENLITHCGLADAGGLTMVRSVRIAVHPDARRLGLARRLVDEIHRVEAPDLFGTVFGATPELLRFRRAVGYELVRVGVSRGSRTGEPAAVMLRPVSARAAALLGTLRAELARALPTQLDLLAREEGWLLAEQLRTDLARGLPAVTPLTEPELRARVARYAHTPQPSELAAYALREFLSSQPALLTHLVGGERALVEARVLDGAPWDVAAKRGAYPSVPVAMRAMRRAFQTLLARTDAPAYDG